MTPAIRAELLEAYSGGRITRREIGDIIGEEVSFGTLLMQLHARGLKLPRFPSDPNSPGVRLVQHLAERGARGG